MRFWLAREHEWMMMGTGRFAEFMPWDGAILGENCGSDLYNKLGAQLQVCVDLQLDIRSLVAVCRVLQSAPKRGKNASGAGQRTKMFCRIL